MTVWVQISLFALPGRLAAEFSVGVRSGTRREITVRVQQPLNVIELRKGTFEFKRPWVVGLRYEKSITHRFGFQGGVHKMLQEAVRPPGYQNVQFDKNPWYYRVGGMATFGLS